jgi:lambda family phage minor tail protein L
MEADLQKLNLAYSLVELFTLDCSGFGGSVYHFTPHFGVGATLDFGGVTYTSIPITSDGWEVTSSGTQPRPTITISNVYSTMLNAVVTLGDIVGAKVTRKRTLERYLDAGVTPDSAQILAPDIYTVEQKVNHTSEVISWQLSSVMDRFGTSLPRRQITRDRFPGVGRQRGAW